MSDSERRAINAVPTVYADEEFGRYLRRGILAGAGLTVTISHGHSSASPT